MVNSVDIFAYLCQPCYDMIYIVFESCARSLNQSDLNFICIMVRSVYAVYYRYISHTFPNFSYVYDLPTKNSYGGIALLAKDSIYNITEIKELQISKDCESFTAFYSCIPI